MAVNEGDGNRQNIFKNRAFWQLVAVIFPLALLIYFPGLKGGFLFDDEEWIPKATQMLGSMGGVLGFWLHPSRLPQYYPLTATTYAVDYRLWGLWTLPYHVENVLLHLVAALLLYQLLRRLRVAGAWLAAAIFAVHPMMVASVAWITERRNMLSLLLFLGALLAYERFRPGMTGEVEGEAAETGAADRRRFYRLAIVLFLAALLAKTAVFPLPAVILVMVWWKTGRIRWRADVVPLLPMFALAAGLCAITFSMEQRYTEVNATANLGLPLLERCLNAGHIFWFYAGSLFWPTELVMVHPLWVVDAHSAAQWLYPATALGVLLAATAGRNRIGRGPAAALFIYAGTLFPVLGFLKVNAMRYSYVWDHWAYLPAIGIIVLAAAGIARLGERQLQPAMRRGGAVILLLCLAIPARERAATYGDPQILWQATLNVNPDCELAEENLGVALEAKGDVQGAAEHYRRAVELTPDNYQALFDYAVAQAKQGKPEEAVALYRRAIAVNPGDVTAHHNLAFTLWQERQADAAMAEYREVLRLTPDDADARYNLGLVLFAKGEFNEAIGEIQEAARQKPGSYSAGQFTESLELNRQAWPLATSADPAARNGARAVELAKAAYAKCPVEQPLILGTLAAAYAEAGRFDEAVQTATAAGGLGTLFGDTNLVQTERECIRLYQSHQAYHVAAGTNGSMVPGDGH